MNRKNVLTTIGAVVGGGVTLALGHWFLIGRHHVTTDNAYVRADITMVAAKTEGYVRKISVHDNAQVTTGSILVTLDPRDTRASVMAAEADLARAQAEAARARAEARRIGSEANRMAAEAAASAAGARQAVALANQARADATSRTLGVTVATEQVAAQSDLVLQAQASLQAAEAAHQVAQADRGRFAALARQGYVSQARMDQVEAQATAAAARLAEARAAVTVARQQVAVVSASRAKSTSDAGSAGAGAQGAQSAAESAAARARAAAAGAVSGRTAIGSAEAAIAAADAAVLAAQARLDAAKLGQAYSEVTAPISGIVANRTVQIGQLVRPGTVLMALVPLDQVYVVANFKETQIGKLAPGQKVALRIDAFPDQKVTGTIESLAPASGSQFSLLPTDTATGNFTKIVQRVPVRIAIDPQWRAKAILRPGLSATIDVDTSSKPTTAPAKVAQR
ncbi:putative multidrug resistance protein EmrK [Candidatus Phycosocius bacilliformis]|uniref:Putative multidrug resistance protein EmrK n=1 Tax=Candidatus Phycosocius bacilliformis TaxID=1445552 RepID=A0A2P2EE95_9PROT|nr:HlyD family secretion protein [Candidatus Phycosocius bacilliformis]GBF59389.1 putative multidrug resistance protein EmrK [Candidatus Phycosocius bacilliformis]